MLEGEARHVEPLVDMQVEAHPHHVKGGDAKEHEHDHQRGQHQQPWRQCLAPRLGGPLDRMKVVCGLSRGRHRKILMSSFRQPMSIVSPTFLPMAPAWSAANSSAPDFR